MHMFPFGSLDTVSAEIRQNLYPASERNGVSVPRFSFTRRTLHATVLAAALCLTAAVGVVLLPGVAVAQETTGGITGTVKDSTGALITNASVEITGKALIGSKKSSVDKNGQYRFVNLPPGNYTVTVSAPNFETSKAENVFISVGRFPTVDVSLKVGSTDVTVEVSAETVTIDQTTTQSATNITAVAIESLPHGASYQSLIALAPAARTEPLQDSTADKNGNTAGYQINGGANAENSYLVEGQETGSIKSGISNANVPTEFIEEVQVKTSGIQAQYQGSMSGTVNVVMKKGSEQWHGTAFAYYSGDKLEANQHGAIRYDPNGTYTPASKQTATYNGFDTPVQTYINKQDHYIYTQPGGRVGGPLWKNRVWGTIAFAPNFTAGRRTVDFGGASGVQTFPYSSERFYLNSRIDATVTQNIRVFGTWLTEYYRSVGDYLPNRDAVNGLVNSSVSSGTSAFPSGIGTVQPNQSFNVGADVTLSKSIIATTRFGHFFDNYADRGWSSGDVYYWGVTNTTKTPVFSLDGVNLSTTSLAGASGYSTASLQSIYAKDADKHDQFTQDFEFIKSGWLGSHDFKVGYSLNHLFNTVSEGYNGPYVRLYPGATRAVAGSQGQTNCAAIEAYNLANYGKAGGTATKCTGNDGYIRIRDYGSAGKAESYNHGLYVQDTWNPRRDLSLNLGARFDKEYLPAYPQLKISGNPIDFDWLDKFGPRLGVAWNVGGKDKLKISANYGKFYDQMKLNLAIGSFGGEFWHDCYYALYSTSYTDVNPSYGSDNHYCSGAADAHFPGGKVPAGLKLIENVDLRATAAGPVAAGLKPYSQHETTFGIEYEVAPKWILAAHWDRRRLDHVIEDAGVLDANGSEIFTIVNPGEGVDKFITGCSACSANVKAVRNYDGIEVELKHALAHGFAGNLSYTYSQLRGNYSGLTNTDMADGGTGGRESANNGRAFDEPYFQYDAYGRASNGVLATDRPNALKFNGAYDKSWSHRHKTSLGLVEQAYSGSPLSAYADVQETGSPVYVEGRGKWIDVTTDANGFAVFGKTYNRRTAAFLQTDGNFNHTFFTDPEKGRSIVFEGIITNVLNQRAVTKLYSQIDSDSTHQGYYIAPAADVDYYTLTHKYDYKALFNEGQIQLNNEYGKPAAYQGGRSIRLRVAYTF